VLTVAGISSIVIFIVVGVSCYNNGLYSTIVMMFAVLLSASLALSLFVPMARVPVFVKVLGWYGPGLCYLVTFLLTLTILQTVANYLLPPRIELSKAVDRIGGAALGLLLALFMTGCLMVGLMMMPGTGGPADKTVLLDSDRFFVKSMAWLSGWPGLKSLDAEGFMEGLKRRRVMLTPKVREGEIDVDLQNAQATERLAELWDAIRSYANAHGGEFPQRPTDLTEYLPRSLQKEEEGVPKGLRDPVTGLEYRLFPFKMLTDARTGVDIVAWTRGVGGPNGDDFMYLGNNVGKRPVLFASGPDSDARHAQVKWLAHQDVRKALREQAKRVSEE